MAKPRDAAAEAGQAPSPGPDRPLRADARRNRERVLAAAIDAFAQEGLSVPVHEIARRAGVGTGTVSRHFPTKEALFSAILSDRLEILVARGCELLAADDPGAAFFAFFALLVSEGARHQGLAEALVGAGYDLDAAVRGTDRDVNRILTELFEKAQCVGAVRDDVRASDLKPLVAACAQPSDPAATARLSQVVTAGLRPDPSELS